MKEEGASGNMLDALTHKAIAVPGGPLVVTKGKNSLGIILKQYSIQLQEKRAG